MKRSVSHFAAPPRQPSAALEDCAKRRGADESQGALSSWTFALSDPERARQWEETIRVQ